MNKVELIGTTEEVITYSHDLSWADRLAFHATLKQIRQAPVLVEPSPSRWTRWAWALARLFGFLL